MQDFDEFIKEHQNLINKHNIIKYRKEACNAIYGDIKNIPNISVLNAIPGTKDVMDKLKNIEAKLDNVNITLSNRISTVSLVIKKIQRYQYKRIFILLLFAIFYFVSFILICNKNIDVIMNFTKTQKSVFTILILGILRLFKIR